jgi:micrococcal nuclease
MLSKKQLNLLFSVIVIFISFVAIIFSDNSSKVVKPFENNPTPTEITDESGNTLGVYSTTSPVVSSVPQSVMDTTENNNDQVEGYKVVKVVDGDTLDVDLDGKIERLRLIGIDTPETVDPRKSVQCFGKEASNKAKELLNGQYVKLENDDSQGERDKYKRLLRYVFLPDGTNFNLFMISEGYAHEYTYSTSYKYQSEFKQAEISARNGNKGLWSPTTCNGNK